MKKETAGPDGFPSDVLTDPFRLASLQSTGLLDSQPEETFDRLTRLAARILDAPVSLVTLVDDKRQFYKSAAGASDELLERGEDPLSLSYCQYVVRSGSPFVVEDARKHPLLQNNPAIEENEAIAYCGVPISDPSGYTLGSLCVLDQEPRVWSDDEVAALIDIAQAAIAEVRLRFLARDLAATNRALREMIASTSHDFRNPLSVILGFSKLLRDDHELPPEERREFAELIHQAATRANVLVEDLLDVSKLEAGVVEPKKLVLDLAAAVEAVRSQKTSGSTEVSNQVPEGLEVSVDPDHLHRIITNLLTNAAKYGAPPISVRAREIEKKVLVRVEDEGPGVPIEFVPHLFEKFARSEDAKASECEGTGLGLAIVAGLAQVNGGSVWYEPNEPTGSRFIVELQTPSSTTS